VKTKSTAEQQKIRELTSYRNEVFEGICLLSSGIPEMHYAKWYVAKFQPR
jgi:hypothetical protein